ncbi:murein transglycosylase [Aeromicrobium sp. S22]|uniref:lytic transglycosylase domain-containing protein n=1 Tax=Aeromicrobium sp. S22 TaxID=2662029 RepID=UPI0013C1AF74|nr:murein transglycosylase [Aeromicrobium sp. S22]MRK01427.1 murein transglycosylase [Aeromicrobium sp. S22]
MRRSTPLIVLVAALAVALALIIVTRPDSEPRADLPVVDRPTPAATPDSLNRTAREAGIPRRALTAYVKAAESLKSSHPRCGLAWNTLAGIGASESSHGAFGGARLDRSGVASPRILGVPLDGTGGNRAIRDTDGGALDGDTTWDRAVGPMQFIPTTWQRWGTSASGGEPDPHDIDDAALSAGRYLCHAGRDLSTSTGWSRAVLTYNRSTAYAEKIARTASAYADVV